MVGYSASMAGATCLSGRLPTIILGWFSLVLIFATLQPVGAAETTEAATPVELNDLPQPAREAWESVTTESRAFPSMESGEWPPSGEKLPAARDLEPFYIPIFANIEWSRSYYVAGPGIEVADDCLNTTGGEMTSFEFTCYGGGESGTTSATVRFYEGASMPPSGLIASFAVLDIPRVPGYLRTLHIEVDPPVALPDSFWLSVEFADASSGLCTGSMDPEYGASENHVWKEGVGLITFSGGTPSNFHLVVFKEVPRPEDFSFSDQTEEAFGYVSGFSGHTAFVDYDQDGWDDISFTTDDIFHNNGDGTFTEVDVPGLEGVGWDMLAWADYDNDGDLDLMTEERDGTDLIERVFRNDDGTFVEVAGPSGTPGPFDNMTCLAWGDYNHDGLLDALCANLGSIFDPYGAGRPDRLWRNNGDDTFTNVTGTGIPSRDRAGRGVAWGDFDDDGDMDVYVSCYWLYKNFLFRNDQSDSMENVAAAMGVSSPYHNAGSCWGDFDNDGDMDLIAPAIHGYPWLYRNDDSVFVEVTIEAGIYDYGEWAAAHFVDINNDGWLDIYAHKWYQGQMARFYVSNGPEYAGGPLTFTDMTFDVGGWRIDSGNSRWGSWADHDNDGDMDLLSKWQPEGSGHVLRLMRNELNNGNHWLHVTLEGTTVNATGIGSRITVVAGDLRQIREVTGQSETGVGHSHRAHFGLGDAAIIDSLIVRWPSGEVTTVTGLVVDQFTLIREGPAAGVSEPTPSVASLALHQCYPNPFNPLTTIRYQLREPAAVAIRIYDVSGRLVRSLVSSDRQARGSYNVVWDGRDDGGRPVAPGVYFCRLEGGGRAETRRMVLVR